MKRFILLLVIGAVVFVLSFSCGSDKTETKPEEGGAIEQETLGDGEDDSTASQPVPEEGQAIEQETLTRGEEEPEDKPR